MSTGSVCECREHKNKFCSYCQPQRTMSHLSDENEKLKYDKKKLREALERIAKSSNGMIRRAAHEALNT